MVIQLHVLPLLTCALLISSISLFTNVPVLETNYNSIDICADVLYHNDSVITPWLSESAFRELMVYVTTGVEFSFDNVMYRQQDGVAMGSPPRSSPR